jgi:D-3-phosphoglycerate dehydrogenase
MKNIIVTDRLSAQALQTLKLEKNFNVLQIQNIEDPQIELAHGLLIRSKTHINAALLSRLKNLEVIVSATSGFDHVDLKETTQAKIKVMHTPEANTVAAAELTWALVLACSRKILNAHRSVKSGEWRSDSLTGYECFGKNYGIVGLGRIGSRVAKIAQAFGMKVLAFDPYKDDEYFEKMNVTRLAYEELIKKSDILSFHVPKTRETQNMFGASQIEYVHPELIIINTSRGGVISEPDISKVLEQRKIRALGLDVFSTEPLSRNSNLLKFDNVVLTPHAGAATFEAFERGSLEAAQKLITYFQNGQTSDVLPPSEDWANRSTQHQVWD